MSVPPVPHRVVLHIGAPKSGTTFIQRALWRHHTTLRERGFLCPGKAARDMFHAAIDVRGTDETWGFEREALAGTWTRLCREAREFPGTSILSHELLAAATEEQVAAALAELEGLDVHVVFTARDLGRQVVSEWQERIKNGSTVSFAEFEKRVARRIATQRFDSLFWRHQHLPAALARWTSDLPPGNVHVVVAPRAGADPGVLWRRFGEAVGFDAESLDPTDPGGRANQTLGIVSIAILRQVNDALQGRIVQPGYARVVKRFLGQDLLARHESLRPSSPPVSGRPCASSRRSGCARSTSGATACTATSRSFSRRSPRCPCPPPTRWTRASRPTSPPRSSPTFWWRWRSSGARSRRWHGPSGPPPGRHAGSGGGCGAGPGGSPAPSCAAEPAPATPPTGGVRRRRPPLR